MKVCDKCGALNDNTALFCKDCGTELFQNLDNEIDRIISETKPFYLSKWFGLIILSIFILIIGYFLLLNKPASNGKSYSTNVSSINEIDTPTTAITSTSEVLKASILENESSTSIASQTPTIVLLRKEMSANIEKSLAEETKTKKKNKDTENYSGRVYQDLMKKENLEKVNLTIKIYPAALIIIDGVNKGNIITGKSLSMKIKKGKHRIQLINEELCGKYSQLINISNDYLYTYSFHTGFLNLDSNPSNLNVNIDEKPFNNTPLRNIKLSQGEHHLILDCPQGSLTKTFSIYEGRIRKLKLSCE